MFQWFFRKAYSLFSVLYSRQKLKHLNITSCMDTNEAHFKMQTELYQSMFVTAFKDGKSYVWDPFSWNISVHHTSTDSVGCCKIYSPLCSAWAAPASVTLLQSPVRAVTDRRFKLCCKLFQMPGYESLNSWAASELMCCVVARADHTEIIWQRGQRWWKISKLSVLCWQLMTTHTHYIKCNHLLRDALLHYWFGSRIHTDIGLAFALLVHVTVCIPAVCMLGVWTQPDGKMWIF